MDFKIKTIKMTYGYSLIKINDFKFKINLHMNDSIDI